MASGLTEDEIREIFVQRGTVDRFKLMIDHETGLLTGSALIEMADDRQAEEAITALDGANLKGNVIKVSQARHQLHRGASAK